MNKKTILDIDVNDKKVLVRVDYNVPLQNGVITDDTRIKESLPTINYLLDHGAKVILMSHLGKPVGWDEKYSIKPVVERLRQYLKNVKVVASNDVVGQDAISKSKQLQKGEVLVLENLRFEKGEEENDPKFVDKLAKLGEIYVNDAFGTTHRKHASTYGVALKLPNAIGFLIEKELKMICGTIDNPVRPLVAILGGAKIKDKIGIVDSLVDKANSIIIGGGMAFTFLKALGYNIGSSLCDMEQVDFCKQVLEKAKANNVEILLPVDVIVAKSIDDKDGMYLKDINIDNGYMGVDIGKKTIKKFVKCIKKAKSVIWNGPMGVFENEAFSNGTFKIAKAVAKCHATTIIGGGDSVSAINHIGLSSKISHISTGGGASLKLFEGKVLPAVDVIENNIF